MKSGLVSLFFIIVLFCCLSPNVRSISIDVDKADNPLTIAGVCGDGKSLTGMLRLTSHGGDIDNVTIIASDLRRTEGDIIVSRKGFRIIGDSDLEDGIPRDVELEIDGISVPGSYIGSIWPFAEGFNFSEASQVNVTVIAKAAPAVALLPEFTGIKADLVRDERIDLSLNNTVRIFIIGTPINWLIVNVLNPLINLLISLANKPPSILLPYSNFIGEVNIPLNNSASFNATFRSAEAIAKGDKTGYYLEYPVLNCTAVQKIIPAKSIGYTKLALSRKDMPPDHYLGKLYINIEDQENPIVVPLDFSVRAGPFHAVLLLFLGIIIGQLYKFYQSEGNDKAKYLRQAYHQKGLIMKMIRWEDKESLKGVIAKEIDDLYHGKGKKEDWEASLNKIEDRRMMLDDVSKFEAQYGNLEGWRNAHMHNLISKIRILCNVQEDESAKKKMIELKELFEGKSNFTPDQIEKLKKAYYLRDLVGQKMHHFDDRDYLLQLIDESVEIISQKDADHESACNRLKDVSTKIAKFNKLSSYENMIMKYRSSHSKGKGDDLTEEKCDRIWNLIDETKLLYRLEKISEADTNMQELDKLIGNFNAINENQKDFSGNIATIGAEKPDFGNTYEGTGYGSRGYASTISIDQILLRISGFFYNEVKPRLRWCYNEWLRPIFQSPSVWLFDTLAWIKGLGAVYTQPLIYAAMILGLTFIGINEIYIQNNTFGTNPFPDYLAVFAWGLGSDVISRNLSNLKG